MLIVGGQSGSHYADMMAAAIQAELCGDDRQ